MPIGLSDGFFVPCIPTKTVNLENGNFREFFRWRGEFCHFKTGIPGGPGPNRFLSKNQSKRKIPLCVSTDRLTNMLMVEN